MSEERRPRRRGRVRLVSALTAGGALVAALVVATLPADAAVKGVVRVDQVGFLTGETKQAYLMSTARVTGATFAVVDQDGDSVLSGRVGGRSRGTWNKAFPAVYPIDLARLSKPGTYQIQVSGTAAATSPKFRVADPATVYGTLVAGGVTFFQAQRSGPDVIAGALGRQPSHLNDASADVFKAPKFTDNGLVAGDDLTRIGGPVDAAGGWYDAGDYLKFTHTAAYGTALLFAAERALGRSAPPALDAEARFGADWLDKMWDADSRTLYLQVGIGAGSAEHDHGFVGDHDLWRLPQDDDADDRAADRFATSHRPVFRAAAPGAKISPNLAGRVSAAFALAAQVTAGRDPARAAAAFDAATSLYAQAATDNPPDPLVTTLPNTYYPERTWHDDMEFGATEIALAAQKLGRDANPYLADAATFARGYLAGETGDTLNLYDTSALAHADLIQAMRTAGSPAGLAVTPAALLLDLRRQVEAAAGRATRDAFHAGGKLTGSDVNAHTFGLLGTEALYRQSSGDPSFAAFATQQRNWLLGANPWGTSFMIGTGTTFPRCPQHQVSNLRASLTGAPVLTGAVVNGPTSDRRGATDGVQDLIKGMVACPPESGDELAEFTGHGSRYTDDVRSWETSEPALDTTGTAVLGAALQQAAAGAPGRPVGDFALKVSADATTVARGQSTALSVRAGDESTVGALVALTVTGLPTGVTVALAPASVLLGREAKMVVLAAPEAPAGKYEIVVSGSASNRTRTAKLTLTVS